MGTNPRLERLTKLERLYEGEQYEGRGLGMPWTKQPQGAPKAPLRFQKPSVQYDLPRIIVDRPTALLFGERVFPHIAFENAPGESDAEVDAWIAAICEEGNLQATALAWARLGAVRGSSVMTWSVVEGEIEFEAHKSQYCTPTFHPRRRRQLLSLEKRYKFCKLVDRTVDGKKITVSEDWWHREEWTETQHIVYADVPVGDGSEPAWRVDEEIDHNLGVCPAVWVKNLDDCEPSNIDGVSLLDGLVDMTEDIDRTLSHKARALFYNLEPEKVYTGLPLDDKGKPIIVGGGATTSLPSGGDAKILELAGTSLEAAEKHLDSQRSRMLEVARVVSPDTDTIARASTSGTAIRMMLGPMLELVGELRSTYGTGLRDLLGQIVDAARAGKLQALGELATAPPAKIGKGRIKLTWPDLATPTPQDLQFIAQAASILKNSGLIDHENLLRAIAPYFGIRDVQQVLANVEKEEAEGYEAQNGSPGSPGRPPEHFLEPRRPPMPPPPKGKAGADNPDAAGAGEGT